MGLRPDNLIALERDYQTKVAQAEDARIRRNHAVWIAIDEGMTHAQIAAAMGMTRARVGQIALQRGAG